MDKNIQTKVAVIGTGAAGFGVLTALLEKKINYEINLFDVGEKLIKAPLLNNHSDESAQSFYDKIYKKIRSLYPFKFPPPKTHFGKQIPRQIVNKCLSIFKSDSFGGLTNYWGATMLPFSDKELKNWPVSKEELYPYYEKIAEIAGLSARPDELDQYFNWNFATRPSIKPIYMLDRLDKVINRHYDHAHYQFVSGLNRCAVETRDNFPNACVYCGECLAGCFRDSIYSTRMTIEKYLKDPHIKYINGKVVKIIKKNNLSGIQTEDGHIRHGYSKVFLCAGCPHTTEIVMRSLNFKGNLSMADNAVYVFPIFYLGRQKSKSKDKSYMSLCNLIVGCIPKNAHESMAQLQIYPNFDYLWRYNTPSFVWPIFRSLLNYSRSRIFLARLYDHSDYSQSYSLKLINDELIMEQEKKARGARIKKILAAVRKTINHEGFYIPPVLLIRQRVNSHYTSTIPYNGNKIKISSLGEVMKDVYICDSSVFPDSPAVNPSFTIMANAYRVADKVMG